MKLIPVSNWKTIMIKLITKVKFFMLSPIQIIFTFHKIILIYTHENQLLSKNIKLKGVAVSNA